MGRRGGQALRSSGRALSRIVRRPAARRDVAALWRYIADDSAASADALVDRIDRALHRLADNPRLGSERPDLATDLRSFVVGNYLRLDQPLADGIRLVRVLHGARNISAELRRR